MENDFWKNIISSKFPSLIGIGFLFWFGVKIYLAQSGPTSKETVGLIMLIIGVTWLFIFLGDSRHREHTDHIIEKQKEAIDNQGKIIASFRQTNNLADKKTRETMSSESQNNGGGGIYGIKGGGDTETTH